MRERAGTVVGRESLGGVSRAGGWDGVVLVALALVQGRMALEGAAQRDVLVAGVVFAVAMVVSRRAPSVVARIGGAAIALAALYVLPLVHVWAPPAAFGAVPWDGIVATAATGAIALHGIARYLGEPEPYESAHRGWLGPLSQCRLPAPLRVGPLTLATLVGVVLVGSLWTLPPGPLADEGMVLFMEGSCDWGGSNVFFFAKVGLLVLVGAVYVMALRYRIRSWAPFVAHYAVGAGLVSWFFSEPECDAYWYGHPQGSIGQMVVEHMALGVLALVAARAVAARGLPVWGQVAAGAGVLLAYAAVFQLGLAVTPHWTWGHTGLIVAGLLGLAAGTGAAGHKSLARSPSPA